MNGVHGVGYGGNIGRGYCSIVLSGSASHYIVIISSGDCGGIGGTWLLGGGCSRCSGGTWIRYPPVRSAGYVGWRFVGTHLLRPASSSLSVLLLLECRGPEKNLHVGLMVRREM